MSDFDCCAEGTHGPTLAEALVADQAAADAWAAATEALDAAQAALVAARDASMAAYAEMRRAEARESAAALVDDPALAEAITRDAAGLAPRDSTSYGR